VQDLLAISTQRLDLGAGRLTAALTGAIAAHRHAFTVKSAALKPLLLTGAIAIKRERMETLARRLGPLAGRALAQAGDRLTNLEKLRLSLDPDRPLSRGFARVQRADGHLARSAGALQSGEPVTLVFHDGDRAAVIDGQPRSPPQRKPSPSPGEQGRLF
jgi:exodeoxyribonuclease VII large subunit